MLLPNDISLDPILLDRLRAAAGAGPVLIMTHDNPDPDALASGKALATLLDAAWGVPSRLVYSGLVLRAENRTLLNLLTPEWEQQDSFGKDEWAQYGAVALVDTQPEAGNNSLPADVVPAIVVDHHHPRRDALQRVGYADVRPEIGATATLMALYLAAAGVELDTDLATAMFYGLKTDTRGLSRGTSPADIAVYLRLLAKIDHRKLVRIEQAGLPREYFRAFDKGLQAAQLYDHAIVANLGEMHRPDLPAELADILIRLQEARVVLCLGVFNETLQLSVRTEPFTTGAGQLVQEIIVHPGKAGGHGTMAGGQIPLAGQDAGAVSAEVIRRFLEAVGETGAGESLT